MGGADVASDFQLVTSVVETQKTTVQDESEPKKKM